MDGNAVTYGLGSAPGPDWLKEMPKPFPIPKFRQNMESNLQEKILTNTDRKSIVQTLATMLMTYTQRPSLQQCEIVAKALLGV